MSCSSLHMPRPTLDSAQNHLASTSCRLMGKPVQHRSLCSRRACNTVCQAKAAVQMLRNPIGVHSQVWVGEWGRENAKKAIEGSKKAGYDLIEINLSQPDAINTTLTKSSLGYYGMTPTASLGLSKQTDISSEDAETVERGRKLLSDAVKVAGAIGSKYLVGVIYCALDKYPGPPSETNWRNCAASLKMVARQAADLGITLGLECVNRYETNLLNTAAQAMRMIEDVGEPNVVVHLDTYHINIEEVSMAAAVAACGDKLGYVHIGESHRGYLGTGMVDWTGLFRALAASRYSGPITFESFSSRVVSSSLSNTLCVWRNLWDDSEDLAVHAKHFIDTNWKAAQLLPRCAATGK